MSVEGAGPGLPDGEALAARIDEAREAVSAATLGHSSASHAVHGWCSDCPGRTLVDEVMAWRHVVQVEAAMARPSRTDGNAATVVLDFDGPLHDYLEGWRDGSIYGNPVEGSRQALETLMAGFAVAIGTARTNLAEVAEAVRRWYGVQTVVDTAAGRCQFWTVRGAVLVTNRKVPAVAYVDDRAYRWQAGSGENLGWQPTLAEVLGNHSWRSVPGPAPFVPITGSGGKPL